MLQQHNKHISYMLYKTYTSHIRQIKPRYNPIAVILLLHFRFLRHEKKSYRNIYTNTMSTYHTCYTKHIQSIFENSHLPQHTHTSLYFPICFIATLTALVYSIYHTCSTKHIQSIFDNSHFFQHTDKSLHISSFFSKQNTKRSKHLLLH